MADNNHLYQRIARTIKKQITTKVLKSGDKLPSLRTVCNEYGVSMSTALEAYHQLEKTGVIESRPQSGFYVARQVDRYPATHQTSSPEPTFGIENIEDIISTVSRNSRKVNLTFAAGVPSYDLLPVSKLNKAMTQVMRELQGSGVLYDHNGNDRLKQQIAKRTFAWGGTLKADDIVTTSGCMEALAFSIISIANRGDTIAVESPVFHGILQLARNLGLNVLELPTNPSNGVELDALKKALGNNKIKLCLLITNFSNPLGSCMPDEHKKELVKMMEHYHVPLIEDDLYGDLYFGAQRPTSCKFYDESGIVLWCGSFSKTVAPGYRVGWVAPGKFKEKIEKTKRCHSVSSNTLTHEAMGYFLENNRYDLHLRSLRLALQTSCHQYLNSITKYFPEGTLVSRPEGGLALWVALHKKADTLKLYDHAMRHRVSIAPGRMFTLQKQYTNCFRLSTGMIWSSKVEAGLKLLGNLTSGL